MRRNELNHMLQMLQTPAYFFDLESHRIVAVNAEFAKVMGYTREELLGMTLEQLRPAEDLPKLKRALAQAPPEGVVEWRYLTRAGELIYVLISYRNNVLVDAEGKPHALRLVVLSRWAPEPVKRADELYSSQATTE